MQKATQLFVTFLLAAIFTVGIVSLLRTRVGGDGQRPGPRPEAGSTTRQPQATAERLREVQDAYLTILRDYPADAGAMRGLVIVRRHLAGDDPVVLRRQAVAYQQMVASGVESPEHYSRQALKVLAAASLQAAAAVESEQRNTAPRANRPGPPVRGAFTPPALPATRVQKAAPPAQPSGAPPPHPGAPPAAPQPAAQGPAGPPTPSPYTVQPTSAPAPQTPPAPSAGPTTPQPPPAGPTAPPADSSEGTVAVVPPPTSGPGLATSEGSLASVDCQKKSFVIHGSNGDEEYLTAPTFTIYVRGLVSERLADFCGLRRHLGRAAVVWSVPDGDRKIAKSMSVVLPAP